LDKGVAQAFDKICSAIDDSNVNVHESSDFKLVVIGDKVLGSNKVSTQAFREMKQFLEKNKDSRSTL